MIVCLALQHTHGANSMRHPKVCHLRNSENKYLLLSDLLTG